MSAPRFTLLLAIARGVGLLLHVPALMALVTMPLCLIFGEYRGIAALAWTAVVAVGGGQALYWPARRHVPTHPREAMLIAALAWLGVSGVAALPFVLGFGTSALDALFESLSGFTGTGLSVLKPSELPHYLQWWRSLSQWIGGVGVIVLLLSILPPRRGALELYYSESREQKLLPSVRSTARAIWSIYLGYTVLGIGLLWLGGVPIWRALNHGLTAIATGGFTITDNSLTDATTVAKLLYPVLMIAGAISFFAHYRALHRPRPGRAWFAGSELRLFWGVVVIGSAALVGDNWLLGQAGWLDSVLQWVSAVTTTGFQSAQLARWHAGVLFALSLVMLVGATAGSTGGGLKMLRIVLLYKSIVWSLAAITRRPHEVLRVTFDGQALTKADARARVRAATTLAIGWVAVSAIAVLVMTHCVAADTPLQVTLFNVLSAQSNVGLAAGQVDADLSAGGKLTLMAVMWMGRLEIVPVMVLVAMLLRRSARQRV